LSLEDDCAVEDLSLEDDCAVEDETVIALLLVIGVGAFGETP
jgi:hypothetical protein